MPENAASRTATIAPGAHIVLRDAEWRVSKIEPTSTGGHAWHVVGVSEIVRDQRAIFLSEYEKDEKLQVLDPKQTRLVADESAYHRASLLYVESLLRQVPPTDATVHLGHKAALDPMEFQLEPAQLALDQLRARILIADTVGLGKTLEGGILLSELMLRGRAQRVLVVTVKSMMEQFQKELWSRFSIPLARLDSTALQRMRRRIPATHNPFHYYDKAIISVDTLKGKGLIRRYVETARWDVIVIDEAQHVAKRRGKTAQRAQLAELLATRSDSLILLSATPHDGSPESFASLMNMLDPTAIANPKRYGPEEIKGLYTRRFKQQVQDQVRARFPERQVHQHQVQASGAEEIALAKLRSLTFSRIDQRKHAGMLFVTTLEKAFFSSPRACLQTIRNRIKSIQGRDDAGDFASDVEQLEELAVLVEAVDNKSFSR